MTLLKARQPGIKINIIQTRNFICYWSPQTKCGLRSEYADCSYNWGNPLQGIFAKREYNYFVLDSTHCIRFRKHCGGFLKIVNCWSDFERFDVLTLSRGIQNSKEGRRKLAKL